MGVGGLGRPRGGGGELSRPRPRCWGSPPEWGSGGQQHPFRQDCNPGAEPWAGRPAVDGRDAGWERETCPSSAEGWGGDRS